MTRYRIKDLLGNYAFVLPALAIFAVFYLYPFYKVFSLSMFQWDGISPDQTFVGLKNFKNVVFNDAYYWQSMKQAGYITFFALTIQNMLALMLALAVDLGIRRGGMIYRVIFFIPPVLSEIVVGLVFFGRMPPHFHTLFFHTGKCLLIDGVEVTDDEVGYNAELFGISRTPVCADDGITGVDQVAVLLGILTGTVGKDDGFRHGFTSSLLR